MSQSRSHKGQLLAPEILQREKEGDLTIGQRLWFCDQIERCLDQNRFLTVALFRDLWLSLIYIGAFDLMMLAKAAEKFGVSIEHFVNWAEVGPNDDTLPLRQGYWSFLSVATNIVRDDLESQEEVQVSR